MRLSHSRSVRTEEVDLALRLQSLVSQLAVLDKTIDEQQNIAIYSWVVPPKFTQIALVNLSTLTIQDVTG